MLQPLADYRCNMVVGKGVEHSFSITAAAYKLCAAKYLELM